MRSVSSARLAGDPGAARHRIADIGRREAHGGEQRQHQHREPDGPGRSGGQDGAPMPELDADARQHHREQIDREPDRGEQQRRLRGLAERGGKARVHDEADRGQPERGQEQHARP